MIANSRVVRWTCVQRRATWSACTVTRSSCASLPPIDGRANAALQAFLAEALDVPRQSLAVVKGETSRRKTVRVADPGTDPGRLMPPK